MSDKLETRPGGPIAHALRVYLRALAATAAFSLLATAFYEIAAATQVFEFWHSWRFVPDTQSWEMHAQWGFSLWIASIVVTAATLPSLALAWRDLANARNWTRAHAYWAPAASFGSLLCAVYVILFRMRIEAVASWAANWSYHAKVLSALSLWGASVGAVAGLAAWFQLRPDRLPQQSTQPFFTANRMRAAAALFIAPAIACLLVTLPFLPFLSPLPDFNEIPRTPNMFADGVQIWLAAMAIALPVTLTLGLGVHRRFQRNGVRGLGAYAGAGAAGALAFCLLMALVAVVTTFQFSSAMGALFILLPGLAIGALTAAFFWLIRRPDKAAPNLVTAAL